MNVPNTKLITTLLCSCALCGLAGSAWANIQSHYKPVKLGSFLITPSIKMQQSFTDNIRAGETNEKSDGRTTLAPELTIEKHIRDHTFTFEGGAKLNKHLSESSEDTNESHASLSSLLVARRSFKIPLLLSYEQSHIDRDAETSALSPTKPTQTKAKHIEGGFIFAPNRLKLKILGKYTENRLENGSTATNQAVIRSDDDHNKTGINATLSYNGRAGWTPFLQFKSHSANFLRASHNGADFTGTPRDYKQSSYLAGLGFDKKTISGHLGAGYEKLSYDHNAPNDLEGLKLSGTVKWQPTRASMLMLNIARRAQDDSALESAYTQNNAHLGLNYELRHNLFVNANTNFAYHDYKTGREDKIYQEQLRLNYVLTPALHANAQFDWKKRDSNAQNQDYTKNIVKFGITGNL